MISVCIPVYNGRRWLDAAIDSVLGQTRSDFELVVVDDGSSDGSAGIVRERARSDRRIRLEENGATIGAVPNHNRCIELARGVLLKFLHQDDRLRPTCLERMGAILEANPKVGFVFCRRDVVLADPEDPVAAAWQETYSELHERFAGLEEVNSGHALLAEYLPSFGYEEFENWIGEPSAVLVRSECLAHVGGFNERVVQSFDIELWLRLMASYDVGFVDAVLVEFRHHRESLTASMAGGDDWLDRLWLFEGLLQDSAFDEERPRLRALRRAELARVSRKQVGRLVRGNRNLRPLARYLAHRIRSRT